LNRNSIKAMACMTCLAPDKLIIDYLRVINKSSWWMSLLSLGNSWNQCTCLCNILLVFVLNAT
jgi:hypothetical protein